jgi:hypothetical protein
MEALLSFPAFKVGVQCLRTGQLPKSVRDFPQFLEIVGSENRPKKGLINI